jgi:hypothetical protein
MNDTMSHNIYILRTIDHTCVLSINNAAIFSNPILWFAIDILSSIESAFVLYEIFEYLVQSYQSATQITALAGISIN